MPSQIKVNASEPSEEMKALIAQFNQLLQDLEDQSITITSKQITVVK